MSMDWRSKKELDIITSNNIISIFLSLFSVMVFAPFNAFLPTEFTKYPVFSYFTTLKIDFGY